MTTSPDERDDDSHDKTKTDEQESAPEYIDDSQLPEDLRPTDDNPLAQNEDE